MKIRKYENKFQERQKKISKNINCLNNIRGIDIQKISLNKNEEYTLQSEEGLVIIYTNDGEISCNKKLMTKHSFFITNVIKPIGIKSIKSNTNIVIIKIPEYKGEIDSDNLPLLIYEEDKTEVIDSQKTPKTISTIWLDKNIVPGLIVGGVRSQGENIVPTHKHPQIEQIFIPFPNNQAKIVIDENKYNFNEIVHIPLGSNHGVLSYEDGAIDYIWIDFIMEDI
ncbi:hypothetical protein QBE53_15345 [Vallitaleaceae bacterium 9-2]